MSNVKNNQFIYNRFYWDNIFRDYIYQTFKVVSHRISESPSWYLLFQNSEAHNIESLSDLQEFINDISDYIANPTLVFDPSNRKFFLSPWASFFNFGHILFLIWLFIPFFVLKVFDRIAKLERNFINICDKIYVV